MKKVILVLLLAVVIVLAFVGKSFYNKIYAPAVTVNNRTEFLHIPTNSNFDNVCIHLEKDSIIVDIETFRWVCKQKKFDTVRAGRYKLENGMSNNDLINLLRGGKQATVKLTFNNIRTLPDLAGKVASYIEADSLEIIDLLNDESFLREQNLTSTTIKALFIPNTYDFFWNTSAEGFFKRMQKEYNRFWTEKRIGKAQNIGLSPFQVTVLASLVQAEQSRFNNEKPRVAGLYINRLNKGMRLQSDPTVIFALGDFSIRRLLKKDLEIDSPYNTYKYSGLPPGPINLPEISSIDAVLNYERHSYLYMCAKDDLSGKHAFSKTLSQHNIYARKYQQALNRQGVMR